MKFAIAEHLTLPDTAITQTFGLFGRKGSGKTYAAGSLVESFLANGVQVIVLDPVGNWYGLRLAKDGRSPSPFEIPILGGERGDIPLETTGGALVAQTVVDTGTSAVLDVSLFRKAERKRFMADFAEELFHRKKTNRTPMHLVIEEAQLFAPQMAKGEERMLGAIEDLVRLGRNYGIGCTMISQRPQSINTEVRNQCEPLIVFQLVAKHERDAIKGWMEHMGVGVELEALSKLKTGECFFWSPAWLDKFLLTRFHEKKSFDASSTPTLSDKHRSSPAKLKDLDLGALQNAMAATIERAQATDPSFLTGQLKKASLEIARLKNELEKRPAAAEPVEVPVILGHDLTVLRQLPDAIREHVRQTVAKAESELAKGLHPLLDLANNVADKVLAKLPETNGRAGINIHKTTAKQWAAVPARTPAANVPKPKLVLPKLPPGTDSWKVGVGVPKNADGSLPEGERKVLICIAQYSDRGGAEREQVSILTGFKRSTRDAYIQRLGTKGYLTIDGRTLFATPEGISALGDFEPLPTGRALQEYWLNRLPEGEAKVLHYAIAAYPVGVSREFISDNSDYARSTRDAYIQRLGVKKLVTATRGEVKASDILFD